jgi:hypothetical protein
MLRKLLASILLLLTKLLVLLLLLQPGWFFPVMLGEGGSAKVYKGRWEGADVALKVVHKQQDFQGLQMEGLLLAGMRHPNLLQPYAFIEDPGQLTWGILLPMYKDGSVRDALFVCAQQPEVSNCCIPQRVSAARDSHRTVQWCTPQ